MSVATTAAASPAPGPAAPIFQNGASYTSLPSGCLEPMVNGVAYYHCGNTWFKPSFGANGTYFTVVAPPG